MSAPNLTAFNALKTFAKAQKRSVESMLAMSAGCDPFNIGQQSKIRDATWFTSHYQRLSFTAGVHLRRIHYRLISGNEPTIKPNGERYQNTDKDFKLLCAASVYARTLGMIDVQDLADHRNPDPVIFRSADTLKTPSFTFSDPWDYALPEIDIDLVAPNFYAPHPVLTGYEYRDSDQPFLLEVWCEKSTLNDVLLPLCRRYGMNLVTSVGFQSITAAIELIKRSQQVKKPARIFYISDFDPAGDAMPIAVARQVEFWIKRFNLNLNIGLTPLALTRQQVKEYHLPRIPIKETDTRRENFEDKYGEGAVELDAMEAIHPGVIQQILIDAITPYFDTELRQQKNAQAAELQREASRRFAWECDSELKELHELKKEIDKIYRSYSDELADIADRLQEDINPYENGVNELREALNKKALDFEIELPEPVQSSIKDLDESRWVFNSSRDYMTQLLSYRQRGAA